MEWFNSTPVRSLKKVSLGYIVGCQAAQRILTPGDEVRVMKVLVACEYSGIVREAFKDKGHDAWSCDLLPTKQPGQHLQCDILEILNNGWDLMIAHPPCTHLASSGARWFKNKQKEQEDAICFVETILNANIKKIAVENPVGKISTMIRKPDQIIQPWQFGEPFTKTTCLWLNNLPKLKPTKIVSRGEFVIHGGKKIAKWYSNREFDRSLTFKGIADAMAEQWGKP